MASAVWVSFSYRLVSEPGWGIFGDGSDMITIYGDSEPARHFISQLAASSSDTVDTSALNPRSAVTFYAKADEPGGDLRIHSYGVSRALEDMYPRRLRLIPRNVQAVGYVSIDGRKQPLSASFEADKAIFHVGLAYRGLLGGAPSMNAGRRMRVPLNQESFYLEKPETASWAGA
ncbi:MAG TPA: hypothetical protein VJ694_04535, partial [Patescibacteria group bacterium]|nr:hypothetical protein [Patescibacteria group bacterium]